jgi:hypothetical protein
MDITFRSIGPWGAGKGANLEPAEVDNNFWSIAEAIIALQNDPSLPNGIASITVSGTQMTITLTDGTVMGPFTLPVLTFRWRGEFAAGAAYAALDVFTFTAGNPSFTDPATVQYGIFMVQIAITPASFDPTEEIGGDPVYLQLFGSTDSLLSTLGDVEITDPLDQNDALLWDDASGKWVNVTLGSMALQNSTSVAITGGRITGMLAPVDPTEVATKAYADSLPAGMTAPDRSMMANIAGAVAPAIPHTLSDFLDYALGTSTRGTLLYRGGTGWLALAPGVPGTFLQTLGAGVDPSWQVGASGVTLITAGAGITTGASAITATGSVALAAVADNNLLANVSGTSVAPSATTLTQLLDHVASSTRGSVLVRAGSGWVALAPGTSGYYLQTQGATADPIWSAPSGSGTVTSISAGTGISTGGAPITGAGTVSLAAIATASVLANISGSSAAPVPSTVSVLFDSVFGSAQGAIVYRNATTWVMLSPGTSGQVLTTGGAAANPAWAAVPAGASVANLRIISNISGSTAAPIGNTLSAIFDAILGSSRGMIVYRGSAGWAALGPGTTGQVLTTGGTAGDPSWAATATGASITVSDTPPASPSPGDAWWDGVSGQLYIRVNDGTSTQWVPASNQPGPPGAGISGLTPTRVPFAATATTLADDGSLVWDNTNKRLGVGATAPGARLTVSANTAALPAPPAGTLVQLGGVDAAAARLVLDTFSTTVGSNVTLRTASGTGAVPTAVGNGQQLGVLAFMGYGTTAYSVGRAVVSAFTTQAWTDAAQGAAIVFNTTPNTTTATAEAMRIDHNGNVGIGQTSPKAGLHVGRGGGVTAIGAPGTLGNAGVYFSGTDGSYGLLYGQATNGDAHLQAQRTDGTATTYNIVMQPNGGNVGIGTTGPSSLLTVNGTCANVSGAWTTISAREVKQDIAPYTRGLDAIVALNPVEFRYAAGTPFAPEDEPSRLLFGLLAEEVQPHVPEIVGSTTAKIGEKEDVAIDTLEPGNLIYALINAVKELSEKVAELEARP